MVVSFIVAVPFSCRARLRTWASFPDLQVTYNYMVVDEAPAEVVDEVFRALADSTRRDILRRCAADEPSVSRLAQAYPMSFAAVQKHVAVLERAGLVVKVRRGREQLVHTDAAAVERARQALDELEATWRRRVERMSSLLATGGTK
jgi:DNA-binding transcriptional ArsR family regulator